jgi:hypothetical protein
MSRAYGLSRKLEARKLEARKLKAESWKPEARSPKAESWKPETDSDSYLYCTYSYLLSLSLLSLES